MWFHCAPIELGFFDVAPCRLVTEALLPAAPLRVFDILAQAESWPHWFEEMSDVRWTTVPPRGVGSKRELELRMLGLRLRLRERFLAWEPGRRLSFAIDAVGLPLLSAGGEDYRLEAAAGEKTRLHWSFYYAPSLATRLAHPVARSLFRRMFARAAGRLARYAGDSRL